LLLFLSSGKSHRDSVLYFVFSTPSSIFISF
jgi:hypothetical protein